jgi:hypothetical protein
VRDEGATLVDVRGEVVARWSKPDEQRCADRGGGRVEKRRRSRAQR